MCRFLRARALSYFEGANVEKRKQIHNFDQDLNAFIAIEQLNLL